MTYGEVGRDLIATTECHRDRYGMGRKKFWNKWRDTKRKATTFGNLTRKAVWFTGWFLSMIGVK